MIDKCEKCGGGSIVVYVSCKEKVEYECGECGSYIIVKHNPGEKEKYKREMGLLMVGARALSIKTKENKMVNIKCEKCGSELVLEYTSCIENTEYACGKCGHHTIVEHTVEEKERYKKERGLLKTIADALFYSVTLFNKNKENK